MIDIFRILTELQAHGVSNAQVARKLDVEPGTIAYWKAGRGLPRLDTGVALLLYYAEVTHSSNMQIFASSRAYKVVVTPTT